MIGQTLLPDCPPVAVPLIATAPPRYGAQSYGAKNQLPKTPETAFDQFVAARAVLTLARTEARQLVEQAQQQADSIRLAAKAEGFVLGQGEFARVLNRISEQNEAALRGAEGRIFEMVLLIAEEVVCSSLRSHADAILQRIKRALCQVDVTTTISLQLNPEDLILVETLTATGTTQLRSPLVLGANPAIERGDVILEFEGTSVTSSPARHLEAIGRALRIEQSSASVSNQRGHDDANS